VGGRSRVAAQVLSGRDFQEVYNLSGGVRAWQGTKAAGPAEVGMGLVTGKESPAEMLLIAYAMEDGLAGFYEKMGESVSDPEAARLFGQLAGMDASHKEKIFELYRKHQAEVTSIEELESRILPEAMEGGLTTEEFLAANQGSMETVGDVLTLAMMLEAQALDLYLRYAQSSEEPETKSVLQHLAEEEKTHLAMLGKIQDKY
jgi:rubrerythrin